MDQFEIIQTLFTANATKVLSLSLKTPTEEVYVMGVYDKQKNNTTFYKWISKYKKFIESQGKLMNFVTA